MTDFEIEDTIVQVAGAALMYTLAHIATPANPEAAVHNMRAASRLETWIIETGISPGQLLAAARCLMANGPLPVEFEDA